MGKDLNIDLNLDELGPIKKQYKKLKKYMKSSIYEVRMMNGTEKTITNLLKENENVLRSISDQTIRKEILVPGRLVNLVVSG